MSVENWIDAIVDVWNTVESHKGGTIRAFYCYKRDEFPEALPAELIPCVLTYTVSLDPDIPAPASHEHWRGVSEFHLFPDNSKANIPQAMLYFAKIRNAAALNMKLGGLVDYFLLRSNATRITGSGIEGPVDLRYGTEDPHTSLLVHWLVKEDVTTEVTVGTG